MDIADLLSQLTNEGETIEKVEIWYNLEKTDYELADFINHKVYVHQLLDNGTLRVHI